MEVPNADAGACGISEGLKMTVLVIGMVKLVVPMCLFAKLKLVGGSPRGGNLIELVIPVVWLIVVVFRAMSTQCYKLLIRSLDVLAEPTNEFLFYVYSTFIHMCPTSFSQATKN